MGARLKVILVTMEFLKNGFSLPGDGSECQRREFGIVAGGASEY